MALMQPKETLQAK